MKCDRCGKNAAEIHLIKIVNGERHVEHLCRECARAILPLNDTAQMMKMSFSLEGMGGIPELFKDLLIGSGIFEENPQSDSLSSDAETPVEDDPLRSLEHDELTDLKNELMLVVRDERYERAARIRDRIAVLEKKRKSVNNR